MEQAASARRVAGRDFDLIVVGDLLYYLSAADLDALLDGLVHAAGAGRRHRRGALPGPGAGRHYDGFNVHAALAARPGLEPVVHHEDDWFLLDILRRVP